HRPEARVTRFPQQQVRELRLDQVCHALATVLRHRILPRSIVQELQPFLAELGELQAVDELYHLSEARIDVPLRPPDLAHPEDRALPQVVVVALRDRHVELVLHSRLDRAQHAALPLEGMVLGQPQLQPENADHHAGRPGAPSGLALGGGGLRALPDLTALGAAGREAPRDLLDLVRLDDVADLHVLEVLESDPALVAAGHLADVLLEAAQAADATLVNHHVVAQQADLAAAEHLPLGDEAARDDTLARHGERLAHLDAAEALLLPRRLEQSLQRVAQVVQRVVDDRVEADVDAFAFRQRGRLGLRPDVEADHDRVRRRRQEDVRLVDAADRPVDDVEPHVLR